ncbi:DUF433 domain-containing protein [Runella sp.]|nr:DUF433 domain-containing protein [Runella sp.]
MDTLFFVILIHPKITKVMVIYKNIITVEAGKRGGKPCIRGMRITVEDILRWLASDMSFDDILMDFPELTREDLTAALEFSANRQHRTLA